MNQMLNTMQNKYIDGKAIAESVLKEVKADVDDMKTQGIEPCLAVILVGEDAASQVYVQHKVAKAKQVGIRSLEFRFNQDSTTTELLSKIDQLNQDPSVHGILVQLPLPPQIDDTQILHKIDPLKDVDGFHRENVGGLSQGQCVLAPCTPMGCLRLLHETLGSDLSGLHAVIIGRSNIVGKPMAALLLQQHCSVTVVHSRSKHLAETCQMADILVATVGQPKLVKADWIKPNAVVIDVGINRMTVDNQSSLVGDVDFEDVLPIAQAITPVPGGVGPMTIAYLMKNTLAAARMQSL